MMDLSYKNVMIHIRLGWGFADFEKKYGLTSDELKAQIGKLCKRQGHAGGLIKQIERNSERASRHVQSAPEEESQLERLTNSDAIAVTEAPKITRDERIAFLRSQEETECGSIYRLKRRYQQLNENLCGKIEKLHELEYELERIKAKLIVSGEEYTHIVADIDEIDAEMASTATAFREHTTRLDDIQEQIAELCKVAICVYADGNVALLEAGADVSLDDTGYEELLPELIVADACQDLRAKDLRVLARLILIERNAKKSGVTIEVISEIEGLEKALETLRTV